MPSRVSSDPARRSGRAQPRVVVADPCAHTRRQVREVLHRAGMRQIYEAADGAEAVALLGAVEPDVLVLDWDLPVIPAAEIIPLARGADDPGGPRLVLTMARPVRDRVERALATGARSIVAKPFSAQSLRSRVGPPEAARVT